MRIANKTGKQQMEISSQISPHHLIGMHRCAGNKIVFERYYVDVFTDYEYELINEALKYMQVRVHY